MRGLLSEKGTLSVAVKNCSDTDMEFVPLFPDMSKTSLPIFFPEL